MAKNSAYLKLTKDDFPVIMFALNHSKTVRCKVPEGDRFSTVDIKRKGRKNFYIVETGLEFTEWESYDHELVSWLKGQVAYSEPAYYRVLS